MIYDLIFNLEEVLEEKMCEKQLAMAHYYYKNQGSLAMAANAFRVALCTVSVVVRKVCYVITTVLGQ